MMPFVYVIVDRVTRQRDIILSWRLALEVYRHEDGSYTFRNRRVERRAWCELRLTSV
jgi:hypothetical protein